jgi:hypothetical protein
MTDYDGAFNFSSFKTYAFYEDAGQGLNDFDVKRVLSIMNSELSKKGFFESENPNFFINIKSKITEIQSNNTIGVGIGNGGVNGGFGISGGIPIGKNMLNEEFVIEFVNSQDNTLFWEAILNSKVKQDRSPEEKIIHFREIVSKILQKYPPK